MGGVPRGTGTRLTARNRRTPDTNDKTELTIAATLTIYKAAHKHTGTQRPHFGMSGRLRVPAGRSACCARMPLLRWQAA